MSRRTIYVRDGRVVAEIRKSARATAAKKWQLVRFQLRPFIQSGIESYKTEAEAISVVQRTWIDTLGGELAVVREGAA
tara:strand:+ start:317 stop:550 length:234 start_codon:yes stop_codon:yes gene_type:complete